MTITYLRLVDEDDCFLLEEVAGGLPFDSTPREILRAEELDSAFCRNRGIADSLIVELNEVESFILFECFQMNV